MNLVIFDVDGTLTDTVQTDNYCLIQAFKDQWGAEVHPGWQQYRYSTDSGVGKEIFLKKYGREPTVDEMNEVKKHFMESMRKALRECPSEFNEVPGAAEAFRVMKEQPDWKVAVSTGSWTDSAILKQKNVSIDFRDIAFATADDSIDRPDILKIAILRSQQLYHILNFDKIVYIGDSTWDVDAARKIKIAFIGRAEKGEEADALIEEGADLIIPDFKDINHFLNTLQKAKIPEKAKNKLNLSH